MREHRNFEPHHRRRFEFYPHSFFFGKTRGALLSQPQPTPLTFTPSRKASYTPIEFADLHPGSSKLAWSVFGWAMANMWDDRGYFYYRVLRFLKIKNFLHEMVSGRMLLALTTLMDMPVCKRTGRSR